MADLFMPIKKKVNDTILHLTLTGLMLVLAGLLIVWTEFLLRILVGAVVIAVAFIFFYLAYRIYSIKKEVEKYFNI